jgi:quercetin dioxygenase-like cupin family protein
VDSGRLLLAPPPGLPVALCSCGAVIAAPAPAVHWFICDHPCNWAHRVRLILPGEPLFGPGGDRG